MKKILLLALMLVLMCCEHNSSTKLIGKFKVDTYEQTMPHGQKTYWYIIWKGESQDSCYYASSEFLCVPSELNYRFSTESPVEFYSLTPVEGEQTISTITVEDDSTTDTR